MKIQGQSTQLLSLVLAAGFLFVSACASQKVSIEHKVSRVSVYPDKIYCHGEDQGRYREVANREVIPYIRDTGRFPQLCSEFFTWEKRQPEVSGNQQQPE